MNGPARGKTIFFPNFLQKIIIKNIFVTSRGNQRVRKKKSLGMSRVGKDNINIEIFSLFLMFAVLVL